MHLLPLFMFFLFIRSNSENETAVYCTSFQCGGREVHYPFWVKNDSVTKHCGYQGFGLDCLPSPSGQYDLFYRLSDEQFYVRHMNHQSITLSESDVLTNTDCPKACQNFTIDEGLPLDYSNLDFLAFYLNCTRPPPFPNFTTQFYEADCMDRQYGPAGRKSYVSNLGRFRQGGDEEASDGFKNWFDICEQKVVTAVTKEEGTNETWDDLGTRFAEAMFEGFVVSYNRETERECSSCEVSKGRCGFNDETQKFVCFCKDGTAHPRDCKGRGTENRSIKLAIGLGTFTICSFTFVLVACCWCHRRSTMVFIFKRKTKEDQNLETMIMQHGISLAPQRYSYSYIKKMTVSFRDKLGQGGYGTVYKGKHSSDQIVAVKILNVAKQNSEEFINEVMSTSRTSHVNIVRLLGFCMEGKRRALVYEYMSNGSLEKYIHCKKNEVKFNLLEMDKLYQISLGVARGLEYLHRGCNTRIMHFDIKPHNILLDEHFRPKISDFGMAKQCKMNESMVSILGARGTIGYIAPELVSRAFGVVSYKSDVYSYGMMILEIVGRRKNVNFETSHASEVYFPHWAYQHLVIDNDLRLKDVTPEEDEIARKIILVGLWCVQNDPSLRPTMSKAIEMLEGELKVIPMPPKSFFGFPSTPLDASSANPTTILL